MDVLPSFILSLIELVCIFSRNLIELNLPSFFISYQARLLHFQASQRAHRHARHQQAQSRLGQCFRQEVCNFEASGPALQPCFRMLLFSRTILEQLVDSYCYLGSHRHEFFSAALCGILECSDIGGHSKKITI